MKWNQYTWYSKWASLLFFILVLPVLTFYIGIKYQKTITVLNFTNSNLILEKRNKDKEDLIKENSSSTLDFIQFTHTWSPCPAHNSIGCKEVFRLNSSGEIFYNNKPNGNLSKDAARELINKSYGVYKSKICTAPKNPGGSLMYYTLQINNEEYTFGASEGGNSICSEMRSIEDEINWNAQVNRE